MPFYGLGRKLKYSMANGALVSVAAVVPPEHEVVLIDENIEAIDFDSLRRFDVIGVTGMVVQSERMSEILRRLRDQPAIVAVGGPLVTVSETTFEDLCDVRFIGEAEETWPAFLNAVCEFRIGRVRVRRAGEPVDYVLALCERHTPDRWNAIRKRAFYNQRRNRKAPCGYCGQLI